MRKTNLGGVYDRLTPEERLQLVLEAAARRDETEVERLANTCQRYRYTFVRNDPAFADRLRASRQITLCVCLMLMEVSAKLMVIRAYQECATLLVGSLASEVDRGFLRGWEAGCDHAWQCGGMAGPFPWRDNGDPAQRADEVTAALPGEDQYTDGEDDDELEAVAEVLAGEIRVLWEAFSRFCRAEIGAEPETVLLAWVPPMQGWIEGALHAADGVRVDAELLLEYETALMDAWHEFLRDA
jgi:hypothetical protein